MSELLIAGGRRGRPPRAQSKSDRPVQFYMTGDEKSALKAMALAERKPVATIIREAVNEYVSDFGERRVFRAGPFE